MSISFRWLLVFVLCGTAGCREESSANESSQSAGEEAPAAASAAVAEETENAAEAEPREPAGPAPLQEADLGSVAQAHRSGDLYLAGQPSREDLELWARNGYRTVVNLRRPTEIDWDEAAVVDAAGMDYVSIPIGSPDDLTDEAFGKVRELLGDPARRPLVLHCASSNRVGAAWMPYRVLDEGASPEEALAEAKQAGLRSPALQERAEQYVAAARDAAASPTEPGN